MDKDIYTEEALQQLDNPEYNQKLSLNPWGTTQETLREMLSTAKEAWWITKKEHGFLWWAHPRTPIFYMLPSVRKNLESRPGRPIISSGSGSLTEPTSQFVNFHIKPLARQVPSYIQDTSHVLKVLHEMRIPADVLLVTLDVKSLYTNIDPDDELKALQHFLWNKPTDDLPP